jgi:hypothetical protein
MSRVLRRPMFRGGYVDSEGTGITSGLTENRIGYQEPNESNNYNFVQGIESQEDRLRRMREESNRKIREENEKRGMPSFSSGAAINPETGLPYTLRDRVKLPPTVRQRAEKEGITFTGDAREQMRQEKEFLKKEEEKKLAAAKLLTEKNNEGLSLKNQKNLIPQKDLPSFFDEYMNMINKANLVNQDEFTRQKYLELAKFGLNLMGQPGGLPGGRRDLFGAISRAAEKPLEGYQNILARESQMKMLPKQLALQASINAMAPGEVEKTMRTLQRIGVPEEKIKDFLLKENTYQQRQQDMAEMEYYKPSLISRFTFLTKKENVKQGLQDTAAQSFLNWKKINPNLTPGLISEMPKDKGLAVDKKYYIDPSTGVIVQFDKKINNYRDSSSE